MSRYIKFEIAREYLHKACECLGGNGGMMLKIKFQKWIKIILEMCNNINIIFTKKIIILS